MNLLERSIQLSCRVARLNGFSLLLSRNNAFFYGKALANAKFKELHSSAICRIKDPYKTLNIDQSADKKAIKKAYYALAKQYHPDTNKEAAAKAKFVEIQHAYDILTDDKKRSVLDQFGAGAFDDTGELNPNFGRQGNGGGFSSDAGDFQGFGGFGSGGINFEDLFGAFTGRGSKRSPFEVFVGADLETSVKIDFMEAVKGAKKSINIRVQSNCNTCDGNGLRKGKSMQKCSTCNGTGHKVHIMQGGFQMSSTCDRCAGSGSSVAPGDACWSCHGQGIVVTPKTVQVDIPAGIEDGMRIKMSGQGDSPGKTENPRGNSRPGDLYVVVHVASHPNFRRLGTDVLHTHEIPMTTAALGGKRMVPTLDEPIEISIKPGTNTGDSLTFPGKGIKRLNSAFSRGNLKVDFKVMTPRNLSPYESQLLEQFAASRGDASTDQKKSWSNGTKVQFEKTGDEGFFKKLSRKLHDT